MRNAVVRYLKALDARAEAERTEGKGGHNWQASEKEMALALAELRHIVGPVDDNELSPGEAIAEHPEREDPRIRAQASDAERLDAEERRFGTTRGRRGAHIPGVVG